MQLFKLMLVVMGNKQCTNVGLMYNIASLFSLTGDTTQGLIWGVDGVAIHPNELYSFIIHNHNCFQIQPAIPLDLFLDHCLLVLEIIQNRLLLYSGMK